jgi:archaellin
LNPDIIVIDGGDIFNFYSFPQLNNFVARAYKIINPDIIVPGDQEFTEGIDFFKKFAAGSKSILLSNAGINGLTTIVQKSYHINNEKRVTINALLEPSIVDSLSAFLTKQTEQFNSLANSLAEEDFNILVFHGTEKYFKENQQVFNNYDLILSAHQVNSIIDTLEVPYHINATTDGESLFYIQLLNSGNSYQIKVEKIDIFKAEYPDKAIEKLIDEYRKMLINL